MSKVFITGGAGFIGANVARELLTHGDELLLHDAFLNFIDPFESNYEKLLKIRLQDIKDKVKIVRGDIRHKGRFLQLMQEFQPDVVVHLAALPIAKQSNMYSEDAFGINLNGTVNILETIRQVSSVKRFVYASSSMTYGNFQYSPADENHPQNPIEVYGATKLASEILTRAYSKRFGLEYTIVRPSAVYGPTDVNKRVSQIFVENALRGKALKLEGGGASKLDFTYVEDIAHGFVLAIKSEKAKNETFNITRGEGRSLKEFVDILKGLIPNLKTEVTPADGERPERGTLDISKARKLLGYEPKYSLEDGIKKYVDFVKKSGII
jgi:nucleoside-diphosphate-sugar epimerase